MTTQQRNFEFSMQVRDYECDLQRVVSNVNYLNYLEHARQQCFTRLLEQTKSTSNLSSLFSIASVDLNYLSPLTLGDEFVVNVSITRAAPHQITFHHDILRLPDRKPILKGAITCALIDNNPSPAMHDSLNQLLGPVSSS